jgi:hypothetical protein
MASLHDESNLRYAGIAIVAGGLLVGTLLGKIIEGALCASEPPVAHISLVSGAAVVLIADLVYRLTHRAAAEREGWRRFINPLSGARIAFVPGWMLAVVLLGYALRAAVSDGFC